MRTLTLKLYRTSNLSARLIQLGMWVYSATRGIKQTTCYNHCEIEVNGESYGAVSPVVRKMNAKEYAESLKHTGKYLDSRIIPLELTEDEFNRGVQFLERSLGTKYEYSMFISHATYILFGFWLGRKRPVKMSCYELMINCINSLGKYPPIDPSINPRQFEEWIKITNLVTH